METVPRTALIIIYQAAPAEQVPDIQIPARKRIEDLEEKYAENLLVFLALEGFFEEPLALCRNWAYAHSHAYMYVRVYCTVDR